MANFTEQDKNWGGLNLDDSDLNINYTPSGEKKGRVDYRNARNIRTAINSAKRGGALTNVLSNLQITEYILPYSGGVFPAGRNRCIGARQVGQDTVLFFVWNENGNNQILRYYRNLTDPSNPFGVVQQVMMYKGTGIGTGGKNQGWGWTRRTRITAINTIESQSASDEYNPRVPGDLTYWSDPVPRMIDIDRANICGKLKSWIFYAPYFSFNSFESGGNFNFTLRNYSNVYVFNATVNIPASVEQPDGTYLFNGNSYVNLQASNSACMEYLASQINTTYGTLISAQANGNSIIIAEISPLLALNSFNYEYTGTVPLKMYAYNWYGTELQDRYFDRCMWQAMDVPTAEYKTDSSYVPNNVQNNVFQFRLLNTYTCASPAAPGLWSGVPINNLQCDGSNNPLLNYIDVNFNNPDLVDDSTLVLFNQVWFIVRLRNTTIGTDKVVIQLDPQQFLDYNGTDWFCHYRFFNNISSTALDPAVSAQLFDDVPRTSVAELENAGLMIEGNVDTGLEAPKNADIDFKVQITEVPTKVLRRVKVRVRILTFALGDAAQEDIGNFYDVFPEYRKYPFWESANPDINYALRRGGIFHDTAVTDSVPFFGGGGFGTGGGGDFGIREGTDSPVKYDQRLPEGGFTVYCAGQPYFGITKQIQTGLVTDSMGALDTSQQQLRDSIGSYLYCGGGGTCSDLYSEVELMLPDGEYVLRVASHWCSFGDVLGKGFMYDLNGQTNFHKTSTNVWNTLGPDNSFIKEKEIKIVVDGSDIPLAGTFVVMDLTPPWTADIGALAWKTVNCYFYDAVDGDLNEISDPNSPNFNGVSIEKALVKYDEPKPDSGQLNAGYDAVCPTDHNGYFFGICDHNPYGSAYPYRLLYGYQINNRKILDTTITYVGTLTDLYTKTLVAINFDGLNATGEPYDLYLTSGIVIANINSARKNCATIINGTVLGVNGEPISGACVVYENGRSVTTNEQGKYSILAWGDMITPNIPHFPGAQLITDNKNRIVDNLVFSAFAICSAAYPNGHEFSPVVIEPIGLNATNTPPPYSTTAIFPIPDFIIDESMFSIIHSLKRGGEYIAGLRVNDYPGRLSTVVGAGQIYIPFDTEDLSLYPYVVDSNGNPFPAGTYIYGQPKILWNFNNTMKPPVDAASYDIMLTKDLFYGNYIQWVIKQAQYVSQLPTADQEAINTSFANSDAVGVLIDISNMTTYNSQNPSGNYNAPTVGYTWTLGDRMRIILDRDNNLIKSPSANLGQTGQMYDFPIVGMTTTNQLILANPSLPFEIKGGFTVEIYTPAQLNPTETQILYEVGQHFDCTNPGGANNAYGTTSGTFSCGDTYWRGRLILVDDSLTNFVGVYPATIEAQDISDFYPSVADDNGRPGQINPANTPLSQKTKMMCSGTYLPDSAINGLSTFNENQPVQATIDPRYGAIVQLLYENNVLQVVCFNKNVTAPINRNLMYEGQSEQSVVSLSGEFFNPLNFRIEAKDLGAEIGASIAHNNGIIFGLNNNTANVWKWFGSEEEVISDRKMITFFKQLQNDGVLDACAVYDKFYEEYVLTYWRKYVINTIPVFMSERGGTVYSFTMPTSQPPYNPLYGNLGKPPEVGSDILLSVIIAGITYQLNGVIYAVTVNGANTLVSVIPDQNIPAAVLSNNTVQSQLTFGLPETITWNEGTELMKSSGEGNVWRSWLDLTPENYCALGADICTFKDGKIWLSTNQGTTPATQRNTFFGTFYNSIITPVFNGVQHQHNVLNKVWNALTMWLTQGNQVGGGNKGLCNFYSNPNQGSGTGVSNIYGQQSRLNAANWIFDENHWSIEFKRDLNDISVPVDLNNPANPLGNRVENGMVLRSEALTVELINDYKGEIVLYSAKGNYTLSAGPIR